MCKPFTRRQYQYNYVFVWRRLLLQDPVLQFAGEACSQNHYSTAHGALSSGQQAAGTILRHYNMLH